MISMFSSFIEFFAAVYVTMAINNDFCENFWTPRYYEELKNILEKYDFQGSTALFERINGDIKDRYEMVQGKAHYRGCLMLFLCVSFLIFIGLEQKSDSCINSTPIVVLTMFVVLELLVSSLITSWRHVALLIAFDCLIILLSTIYNAEIAAECTYISRIYD